MQDLLVIDNHSIAPWLLNDGWVLDAGSRGYVFSRELAKRGCKVLALDPAEDVPVLNERGIYTARVGLVGIGQPKRWIMEYGSDPNAYRLDRPADNQNSGGVATMTITECMSEYDIRHFDLVKLNIEGAEYDVLDTLPGPIATQIVFSFHEHTDKARGRAECDRIIDKLKQWYEIRNQVWEKRYGCRESYWDVVAIKRGL
jgi:FkbM family methyltransferase